MAHQRLLHRFIPVWTEAPMLRLLVPLMGGILLQWYLPVSFWVILFTAIISLILTGFFYRLQKKRFLFSAALQLLLVALGAILVWLNDTRHQPQFVGKVYTDSAVLLATLQEPLVEKERSYKAEATVMILQKGQLQSTAGRIILYFKKDSFNGKPTLDYGSQIMFSRPLQPIQNAGNPGGFDYERYSGFHNLYYQVFLSQKDYSVQPQRVINPFRQHLFTMQQYVLQTFKKYIPGSIESGMAEALLIGYRNDLDRDLVQLYSNTGVVHIIAISGMHLGLIYWMVIQLFRPVRKNRYTLLAQALLVVAVLWLFSLLTGASPSILRSAVMFTFIALGKISQRRSSVYNNLAISAFLILLTDPFSLWDVGFQLSYAAVLSIAIFAKPLTGLFYFNYKILNGLWQLVCVTTAAQILTYPLVAYHFHQFPTLFLITNIIAVPLSSGLIFALIGLLAVSWWHAGGLFVGKIIQWSIQLMNEFVSRIAAIPYSLIDGISFTIPLVILLFVAIAAASWWLLQRSAKGFVAALAALSAFAVLYTWKHITEVRQHELIIYNVPQHAAVDVVAGKQYLFIGDTVLLEDGFLQNFHLKPSRVLHQVQLTHTLLNVNIASNAMQLGNTKVVFVNSKMLLSATSFIHPDVLIITGNPTIRLEEVNSVFHPKIIVADGTNKFYRINQWQQEAGRLHLRFHPVAEQGAFVMKW